MRGAPAARPRRGMSKASRKLHRWPRGRNGVTCMLGGYSPSDLGSIFAMQAFDGLILFSVFVLMSLGLAIIFGQMGVINMAHGEFMILGAYMTWMTSHVFQTYLPRRVLRCSTSLSRWSIAVHRLRGARPPGRMGADTASLCASARLAACDLGPEPHHAAGVPFDFRRPRSRS